MADEPVFDGDRGRFDNIDLGKILRGEAGGKGAGDQMGWIDAVVAK